MPPKIEQLREDSHLVRKSLFENGAVRAIAEVLYQRLLNTCWEQVNEVFSRPEIQEAERLILSALAEAFAPKKKQSPQKA
jgi:hypothetical protein